MPHKRKAISVLLRILRGLLVGVTVGVILGVLVFNVQRYYVYVKDKPVREQLFAELSPVPLENCTLVRLGDAHDGGYLICGNLMTHVQSAYSYGIEGRDEWGCDVSRIYNLTVHQYDCFDTRRPACENGKFVFHEECVGDKNDISENRVFDRLESQIAKNKDGGKNLVVKVDIEGAEWDTLWATPDEVLNRIDQLVVEFHGVNQEKYVSVIQKLRTVFYPVHLHFNNYACADLIQPFPAQAYEVLFVNKRIGIPVRQGHVPTAPASLDAPNSPLKEDCQKCKAFEFTFFEELEHLRQAVLRWAGQTAN